jgi:hypothetical protein
MKAAGALCGLPRGLRDNIALTYLLATKRKRLPHERNGSLKVLATSWVRGEERCQWPLY